MSYLVDMKDPVNLGKEPDTVNTDVKMGIAMIFLDGQGQAIRLPKGFHVTGNRMLVRKVKDGLLLQPMYTNDEEWFAALDRYADIPFMEEEREQPPMPEDEEDHMF